MTASSLDGGSARAELLEALDAYLAAVRAAAAQVIETQPAPSAEEIRGLATVTLIESSGAATALASALLQGATALPPELLIGPVANAAIAGALLVPAAQAREWAQRARAATAGIVVPGGN